MEYDVVIGLEVHCELKTNSKNFGSAKNSYSDIPNSNISINDICFPGTLPVTNKEAVRKALKMALAMNCKTPDEMIFDRKNYYYPDLPKSFQLTQDEKPVGINGYVMINIDGVDKKILINNTHLEEDTASLEHFGNYSLINYNRLGVPLLETVTEPCLNSSKEAVEFLETLRSIFLYTETSEARSDRGEMRCDVNISLKPKGQKELGTRVEIKNVNSFNNVRLAIEHEIKRHTEILNSGGIILQETRRYSDVDDCTYTMRSKEDAIDYRYYPEPNLPPVKISKEWLEEIKSEIPPLQYNRIQVYMNEQGLSRYDATILVSEKAVAEYYEEAIKSGGDPKTVANWINTVILGHITKFEKKITDIYVTPQMLVDLIKMVDEGKISSKQSKEVIYKSLQEEKDPKKVVEESGMKQLSDDSEIRAMVIEILEEHSHLIEEHRKGKNVFDFFVGQVMKRTRGQANPSMTAEIIREEIEKR